MTTHQREGIAMTTTLAIHRKHVRRLATAIAVLALGTSAAACGGDDNAPAATINDAVPTTTTAPVPEPTDERPTETYDQLVAITDGRLHIRCSGSGGSTVLLIAGWDHASADWAAVEPAIAERTRVCSYDRFGTGTSDAPVSPQTFDMQVADLRELLDNAGEPGPYVVVGHSFGGAEAVTFASTYPDEVVGLVLVDASPDTWPDTVCSVPAYASGCELMRNPSQGERLDVFPAFKAVAAINSLGDLPMTVITDLHRDDHTLPESELARLDAIWAEGADRWAGLSTASRLVTVEDTTHDIQTVHPALVIDEILELIA